MRQGDLADKGIDPVTFKQVWLSSDVASLTAAKGDSLKY